MIVKSIPKLSHQVSTVRLTFTSLQHLHVLPADTPVFSFSSPLPMVIPPHQALGPALPNNPGEFALGVSTPVPNARFGDVYPVPIPEPAGLATPDEVGGDVVGDEA